MRAQGYAPAKELSAEADSSTLKRAPHLPAYARTSLAGSLAAGTLREKQEPWPDALSTVISPPIIWQNFLLMANPSPVPPYLRVAELSTWEKGRNSLPISSASMPMPVSETRTSVQ